MKQLAIIRSEVRNLTAIVKDNASARGPDGSCQHKLCFFCSIAELYIIVVIMVLLRYHVRYIVVSTTTTTSEHNSGSDDDDDTFNLPCVTIKDLKMLNAEIKASTERRKELVSRCMFLSLHVVYMSVDLVLCINQICNY